MNFTSGATIYHQMNNIGEALDDYRKHLNTIPPNTMTRQLVEKEIIQMNKHFDQWGKSMYISKSDYEKDIREQNEHINSLYTDLRLAIGEEEFKERYPHADIPF